MSAYVLREELLVNDVLEELATLTVLEYEEAYLHPVPNLIKLDDVRVIQAL